MPPPGTSVKPLHGDSRRDDRISTSLDNDRLLLVAHFGSPKACTHVSSSACKMPRRAPCYQADLTPRPRLDRGAPGPPQHTVEAGRASAGDPRGGRPSGRGLPNHRLVRTVGPASRDADIGTGRSACPTGRAGDWVPSERRVSKPTHGENTD